MSESSTSPSVLGASAGVTGAACASLLWNNCIFKGILAALIAALLILIGYRLYKWYLSRNQAN